MYPVDDALRHIADKAIVVRSQFKEAAVGAHLVDAFHEDAHPGVVTAVDDWAWEDAEFALLGRLRRTVEMRISAARPPWVTLVSLLPSRRASRALPTMGLFPFADSVLGGLLRVPRRLFLGPSAVLLQELLSFPKYIVSMFNGLLVGFLRFLGFLLGLTAGFFVEVTIEIRKRWLYGQVRDWGQIWLRFMGGDRGSSVPCSFRLRAGGQNSVGQVTDYA